MRPQFLARHLVVAAALAAGFTTAPVQAQQERIVSIPEKAVRGDMTFQGGIDVAIDGRAARLAPGARIFDRNNFLLMFGSLAGTYKVKYLIEDTTGLVLSVWMLTEREIATPDPRPVTQ